MDNLPDNRLVLFPRSIVARASAESISNLLREQGLINGGLQDSRYPEFSGHYLAGERFFDHISFVGCSPNINLAPPKDIHEYGSEFCHVDVRSGDKVEFIGGDNVRPPSCPQCKTLDKAWQALLPRWAKAPEVFTRQCAECGATKPLHMFNWRQRAGFAALSIHIWGVHEGEAVPNNTLMESLGELTRCTWDYLYLVNYS